ncbi:DUF2785 domain-containing protein [Brevibacillus migulae]|uniref:DUF2785 domain-containing protein n=1 Tax=Brevibacillus migulae TaxID=1644114 RepID=UPI00106DE1C3|nr:DUF2785 domain-containing protein [Brevibacillus migulae]
MNDTRTSFMLTLKRMEAEHYTLREGEQIQDVLTLMLRYIGDPDPALRDELIYPAFYAWIHDETKLSAAELRSLLYTLLDEQHLFYQIGSEGDSSVFTRAFSSLPIALIVRRHRQNPFLNQADYEQLKDSLLRYYREEKDLRGYLSEDGWAHSAAHGADALMELVQCPESNTGVQLEVLAAIAGMLHNGHHIFHDEEDERIASIVDTMIEKELLPQQMIADWISSLALCASWPRSRNQVIARVNSKNFLRCLYFRRARDIRENGLTADMLAAETALNKFAI